MQAQLEQVLSELDRLTAADDFDPVELVAAEREAAALTGTITRLDGTIEDIDRQLLAAQEAQARADLLDRLEAAARAALQGTAEEQVAYDAIAQDLEALFARVVTASEKGQRPRSVFRNLLLVHARAHVALAYPGDFKPAQEDRAQQVDDDLTARGVSITEALEAEARLRGGAALWSVIREWQRETPALWRLHNDHLDDPACKNPCRRRRAGPGRSRRRAGSARRHLYSARGIVL